MLQTEIDKDVNVTAEFTDFLQQVAKKGNTISFKGGIDEDDCNSYSY